MASKRFATPALQFRQAERRSDDGSLCDEQVQRLGQTFIALSERMAELRESSAWTRRTFNLNLGPLGKLL